MRIIRVTHCLICPYGKYKLDLGLYCRIAEGLVADIEIVEAWDAVPDLGEWIHKDCPLEDVRGIVR